MENSKNQTTDTVSSEDELPRAKQLREKYEKLLQTSPEGNPELQQLHERYREYLQEANKSLQAATVATPGDNNRDQEIQDGDGGKNGNSFETQRNSGTHAQSHFFHYDYLKGYIGKVIFAAFDIDGKGKYSQYPEGGLTARKGQAIILKKFIGSKNLGFGCIKTKLIVSRKKYGYFHLSQVTTVKPM